MGESVKVKQFLLVMSFAVVASAQVPANIEAGLVKMGHIVDPPCTAKLYRPLMPANDIRSSTTPLYPGITVMRDTSFGSNPKDVVDIFTADKGPASRPVLIYVPGGPGNKIELQDPEANAFYDNIGRWATKNGMVYVQMQRHGGPGLGCRRKGHFEPCSSGWKRIFRNTMAIRTACLFGRIRPATCRSALTSDGRSCTDPKEWA